MLSVQPRPCLVRKYKKRNYGKKRARSHDIFWNIKQCAEWKDCKGFKTWDSAGHGATVALLSEAPSSIGHTGALAKLWNWPVFIWLRAVLVIILWCCDGYITSSCDSMGGYGGGPSCAMSAMLLQGWHRFAASAHGSFTRDFLPKIAGFGSKIIFQLRWTYQHCRATQKEPSICWAFPCLSHGQSTVFVISSDVFRLQGVVSAFTLQFQ